MIAQSPITESACPPLPAGLPARQHRPPPPSPTSHGAINGQKADRGRQELIHGSNKAVMNVITAGKEQTEQILGFEIRF